MISIVMSYFNRIKQLQKTLNSIDASSIKDIEIVLVDDFSEESQDPSDLIKLYSNLNIKLIKMRDIDGVKKYINPCVPYNVGLRASTGDIVMIQNPECYHMGDVLLFTQQYCNDSIYFAYNCYALNKIDTEIFHEQGKIEQYRHQRGSYETSGWYNHHEVSPTGFHFCASLTRKNLILLNGFDERYAYGACYDDNEFLERVQRMGLKVDFVYNPFVVHQYHDLTIPLNHPFKRCNEVLLREMTRVENKITVTNNRGFIT